MNGLPGLPRLRHVARRLRAWTRSASIVLLYHRVARLAHDPWSLAVRPDRFEAQLEVLARHGGVVSLTELQAGLVAGDRRPRIALTFDDGYGDFLSDALPALAGHALPATLFATTGTLDGEREFWWDDLERCLFGDGARPAILTADLPAGPRTFDVPTRRAERYGLYQALHTIAGRLPAPPRERLLASLRAWASIDAAPRPSHRPLRADELRQAARGTQVAIGAHTVHHPYLSALPEAEQRREIIGAKWHLEELLGRPVDWFSLPHGDRNATTDGVVRAAGFAGTCGSACTVVRPGENHAVLPRVEVGDLDGPAFAHWLGEWVR